MLQILVEVVKTRGHPGNPSWFANLYCPGAKNKNLAPSDKGNTLIDGTKTANKKSDVGGMMLMTVKHRLDKKASKAIADGADEKIDSHRAGAELQEIAVDFFGGDDEMVLEELTEGVVL